MRFCHPSTIHYGTCAKVQMQASVGGCNIENQSCSIGSQFVICQLRVAKQVGPTHDGNMSHNQKPLEYVAAVSAPTISFDDSTDSLDSSGVMMPDIMTAGGSPVDDGVDGTHMVSSNAWPANRCSFCWLDNSKMLCHAQQAQHAPCVRNFIVLKAAEPECC